MQKLKEIQVKNKDFPIVLFSDSHTNIVNIRKLKKLYPNNLILCLGDFTSLFCKEPKFNKLSIDYLIDNKILSLLGNHESHILQCESGDSFRTHLIGESLCIDYDLEQYQINFLRNLPIGFKLILPNSKHYLLYHNSPDDLWGFRDEKYTEEAFSVGFKNVNGFTLACVRGHEHREIKLKFKKCDLITIGRLAKEGSYAIIDEKGLSFRKI